MAEHDWETLHEALGNATAEHSREELVALLRDLIREYVIERGLPTGTPGQAAATDLSGMDFPQLIRHLKATLSLAELDLFTVDGARVLVDADGPRAIEVPRPARPGPVAPRPAANEPKVQSEAQKRAEADRPVSRRFKNLEID